MNTEEFNDFHKELREDNVTQHDLAQALRKIKSLDLFDLMLEHAPLLQETMVEAVSESMFKQKEKERLLRSNLCFYEECDDLLLERYY